MLQRLRSPFDVRLLLMLAVTAAGISLGLIVTGVFSTGSGPEHTDDILNSAAEQLPGPRSVQDLANRGDAIVIASIASVGETRYEGAFDPTTGEFGVVTPEEGQPTLGFQVTYYELDIEEILVDDGLISKTAVFRVPGTPGSVFQPLEGHRYLLVLGSNADDASYGSYGFWGELDLTGKVVKDIRGLEIGYTASNRPSEFLEEVKAALPNRVPTGPADWMRQWGESLQP